MGRRLDTDERRAQLVTLGLLHFGRRAYDDVSIDDIAASAGISKGLLYHYFPTKRAFYAACVAEAAQQLLSACTHLIPADLAPLEQLDRGLMAYLEYVKEHRRAYANLMSSGVRFREVAKIVDDTRAKLIDDLVEGVGSAVKLTPLVEIALRGWVGLAETATLAWAQAIESGARIPATKMRDLLKTALLSILGSPHL